MPVRVGVVGPEDRLRPVEAFGPNTSSPTTVPLVGVVCWVRTMLSVLLSPNTPAGATFCALVGVCGRRTGEDKVNPVANLAAGEDAVTLTMLGSCLPGLSAAAAGDVEPFRASADEGE